MQKRKMFIYSPRQISNLSTLRKLLVLSAVSFLVCINVCVLPRNCWATAENVSVTGSASNQYDPIVIPISGAAVQAGLIRNSKNAQDEYALLLRAGYQHQEKAAYDTMNRLRREQPNNPIVLAGYFMTVRMAEGGPNSLPYNGGHQAISINNRDDDEAKALLKKAYQLAPDLWLTYAIDGEDKFYVPGGDRKQGLALLQKAAQLAPDVPYVHWLLGNAYLFPSPKQHN